MASQHCPNVDPILSSKSAFGVYFVSGEQATSSAQNLGRQQVRSECPNVVSSALAIPRGDEHTYPLHVFGVRQISDMITSPDVKAAELRY